MNDFVKMMEMAIGCFVCSDAGIYRGQCTQFPRHMLLQCGGSWTGKTYNGDRVVDRVVELGGYYGESSRGYRICSGVGVNHTWIEVKINGQWVIYEQNCNKAGVPTANFGSCGTVWAVSKSYQRGAWRDKARYAGHPIIDAYIDAHSSQPTPTPIPTPTPTPEPQDDCIYYTYQNGDSFGSVLQRLGLMGSWDNDTVAYYTEQLHEQGIWGNIPIGTTIKLKKR